MMAAYSRRTSAAGAAALWMMAAFAAALLVTSDAPLLSIVQTTALQIVPIVGHWERHSEGGEPVITADGTKWNKQLVPDATSTARQLFKTPDAAFARNASSAAAFPLAAVRDVDNFKGRTARVRFKLVAGATDQIAGLAFNLRPNGEYLVVRYNTKDGNVALWKYADGARTRVADGTAHAQLPLGVWHTLALQVNGRAVMAEVNQQLRLEHALDQPVEGRVGFWAKPDSITAFKGLTIEER